LEKIVVNYFLRKTSLVTHVGQIKGLNGKMLYQSTLFIIDVCVMVCTIDMEQAGLLCRYFSYVSEAHFCVLKLL